MSLLTGEERRILGAISRLAYANQFSPQRREAERDMLGTAYREVEGTRGLPVEDPNQPDPNRIQTDILLEELVPRITERLTTSGDVPEGDLELYQDAAWLLLYRRRLEDLRAVVYAAEDAGACREPVGAYRKFLQGWRALFEIPELRWRPSIDADHLFAFLFQIQRAFHYIFQSIVGQSTVAAKLRADVWRSVFTHDMRRYGDTLYNRMNDVTTLITGPSGTGKELVARAIGLSRYIPFDSKAARFVDDYIAGFHALNLSAMPSALIESELFGHKRGAFTGALSHRKGWLEVCQPSGTVFLDEIGELDPAIQVKLLRVLQTHSFQPVGDTADKQFLGKIVAATNRDLAEAMHSGALREDFYYRICSDMIVTPSLQMQLSESPGVLHELLLFIARRMVGVAAESLVKEAEQWIGDSLGHDYPWPGNIRELEQCVRSVMIRGEYYPPRPPRLPVLEETVEGIELGSFTADELLVRYCTSVYAKTGNYQETARRLRLDRRTVKSRIDPDLLLRLQES